MPNLQEIANVAYRIKESANGLQERTMITAEVLGSHGNELSELIHGQSKTGVEAVQLIGEAQRMTAACAVSLKKLNDVAEDFLKHLAE
ncbi:hypothetical protein [Glutamicibacter sp. NPDC087344]|uniref:hypothetical protein n=1 Tax=Glutamicibacter sp. NPDC087344 TaxID=3363994 RepID=UPI00381F2202